MATEENWLERIYLGEDSALELKTVKVSPGGRVLEPHPDGLSDELSAMANASGGSVILGVADKTRHVVGIDAELDAVETWITAICRDRVDPPSDIETRNLMLPDPSGDKRPVILIEVPRSLWVHKSANGYFKRIGNAKREMPPDMLARLFQQRSRVRLIWFEEQPVQGTGPGDLDPLLIRTFIREGEGKPETRLGRIDYPQYSLRAVFEAIVNAVAHRDYSLRGGRIRLHMFADRLELHSPGSLPNSLTVESMASVSLSRNELIASLFALYFAVRDEGLGRQLLMDRRGAGVDIILSESKALSGKLPVYTDLSGTELRLTIFAAPPP